MSDTQLFIHDPFAPTFPIENVNGIKVKASQIQGNLTIVHHK
jgi:hypothetical protein